jgi:hypothetical protein
VKQLLLNPLAQPCCHPPTPEEAQRDPAYTGCFAASGQPCSWAQRHDGEADPPFHSERLEAAARQAWPTEPHSGQTTDETFDQAVLNTGLV